MFVAPLAHNLWADLCIHFRALALRMTVKHEEKRGLYTMIFLHYKTRRKHHGTLNNITIYEGF